MAGILPGVIGNMESERRVRESLALAYWPRIVGEQAAAATEPETVRNGILFIRSKSSVWSHELTLHKEHILRRLNQALGAELITQIVFRARGFAPKTEEPIPDAPPPEELASVVLETWEKAQLRARLHDLISIEDDRIRRAIASRMTQEAKLRHWRLENGWRVCPRCNNVHKTEDPICPGCRLIP